MVQTDGQGVGLSVQIEAPPERVFSILATSAGISRWLGCEAEFDPKVGTSFRLRFPQFQTTIEGEVLEFTEGERIVMTWGASEGAQADTLPVGSSKVTLAVAPSEHGTKVAVTHEFLPSPEEEKNHAQGWRFHLSRLGLISNREALEAHLPSLLDAYFAAWSTDDSEERLRLFESTCSEHISYGDDFAALTGRSLLALHAANSRMYMPDIDVRRVGMPVVCRGNAIVRWEAFKGSDPVQSGINQMVVDQDGKLSRVIAYAGAFAGDA